MTDSREPKSRDTLRWSGAHGERVELSIQGYQFPHIGEGYDANWLVMEGAFTNELGSWQRAVPFVLTWELHWLARWLPNVVQGFADNHFLFLEMDLTFQHLARIDDVDHFAVVLAYGFSPPSEAIADRAEGSRDRALLVTRVSSAELATTVEVVERWVRQFPVRGEQGRRSLESLPGPRIATSWRLPR